MVEPGKKGSLEALERAGSHGFQCLPPLGLGKPCQSTELSQGGLALLAVLRLHLRVHSSEKTEGSLKTIVWQGKQRLGISKAWASHCIFI